MLPAKVMLLGFFHTDFASLCFYILFDHFEGECVIFSARRYLHLHIDSQSPQDALYVYNYMTDASAGGESQGGAMEASGRHLDAEEGLYLPEPDRASLHDSEGLLNVHTARSERND